MMKALLIFTAALLTTSFTMAQTYLSKDFDDLSVTSGGWDTNAVVGTPFQWEPYNFGGEDFARMTNFNVSNFLSEAWLISPAVNLTTATS